MNLDANRDDCSDEQVQQVTISVLITCTMNVDTPGLSKTNPDQNSMDNSKTEFSSYRMECTMKLMHFNACPYFVAFLIPIPKMPTLLLQPVN